MHDEPITPDASGGVGMDRREMLKRSALVGGAGALMWAAPSVTTFGPRAFGAEGTPASDFSNFGALVLCTEPDGSTTLYKIKGEANGAPSFTWVDAGDGESLGQCTDKVDGWDGATGAFGPDLGATFTQSGDDYVMTLTGSTAPQYENCTFAMQNGAAASLQQGQCCIGAQSVTATQIRWDGPFPNGSPNQPCSDHPNNLE